MVLTQDSTKDAELADSAKDTGLAEIAESAMPLDVIWPPSDLYSDEPPLETDIHLRQILLLLSSLESGAFHSRHIRQRALKVRQVVD